MTCPVVVNLRQHGAGKQLGYRSRGAGQDRASWAFNTQPYMLEQFRLYITSTSAIGPNIRSETVLGNLKNDAWFDRELLAGVDTMSHPAERPATPAVPSTPLQESHPSILSESSGSESDPISSTSECPCCRLPPVPEPSTLGEAIPQLDLNNSAALEERFLKSLAIQPAVGSTVQAAAVVPRDRRAAGHYLLIDLLCHRLFSTFRHQGGIRNFSVYYYKRFIPGDTLTVVARRVFRSQLSWLEATVARDSVLVATATALYDAAGLEAEASAEKLFTDFDGVHHCAVSDDRDLW